MSGSGPSELGGAARLLLASYPPSFRDRYGAELSALVEDTGSGGRVLADLARGSVSAWLRPAFGPEPATRLAGRRLATVGTVWVCWCAVFVMTPAVLRAVEDPPPPGYDPSAAGWRVVHNVLSAGLIAGWLLIGVVGVPLGLWALRHRPAVRRLVAGPVALLVCCGVLFIPISWYARTHWGARGAPASPSQIPVWWALLGLVWLLSLGVDAAWGTVALALAVRRCEVSAHQLKTLSVAAGLLVVPMWVVAGLVLSVAFLGAGPGAAGPFMLAVYGAAVTLIASVVVASVSTLRAVRLSR